MRLSQLLISHRSGDDDRPDLLACAGYTHRLTDGVYSLLPLGHRVMQRIDALVRREMARIGAQEVRMPLLQPEQLWQQRIAEETRAVTFGAQLFRIRDRDDKRLILAPTHEEVAALLGALCIRDVRALPRVLYQIQPRFRDQRCAAENGLLQTREFVMADAYSFHSDRASLDEGYAAVKEAFCRIAAACGVRVEVVSADAGVMGGEESEELIARLPNSATTAAVRCEGCGYAASIEIAEFERSPSSERPLAVEEVAAPDGLSAEAVSNWLGLPAAKRLVWTPFVTAGGRIVLAVIPGDLSLNPVKFLHALSRSGISATDLHPASAEDLALLGMNYDSISLVKTPPSVVVLADEAIRSGANFFVPSLRPNHFLINVNRNRDFRVDAFADLGVAYDGAPCPRCGGRLRAISGIEVGHVFKLGNRYAAAFGAEIASAEGLSRPLEMGCYGLGTTRLMATIVEQMRDDRGIVWPEAVAPYLAVIVPLSMNNNILSAAEQLYLELCASKIDVLFDDTSADFTAKVRNADLLGIPLQIVFSEDVAADGSAVEIWERKSSDRRRALTAEIRSLLMGRHSTI